MIRVVKIFLVLILACLAVVLGSQKAFAQEAPQRFIVVFRGPTSDQEKQALVSRHQGSLNRHLHLINAVAVKLPPTALVALKQEARVLRIDPDIQVMAVDPQISPGQTPPVTPFVSLDEANTNLSQPTNFNWCGIFPFLPQCLLNSTRRPRPRPTPTLTPRPTTTPLPTSLPTPTLTPTLTPTPTVTPIPAPTAAPTPIPTPVNSNQPIPWGVSRIQAPLAWLTTRGSGAKVAIIDTGVDLSHQDLSANIAGCLSFVFYTTSCNDDNGHGTHVSGIVAAIDNSFGVVGVAPRASLYELKVLDYNGSGYLSDIISALGWASANGIQVINMSLGTSANIQSFHDAITAAYNSGVVEVAAAGNSGPGTNTVLYPAAYPEVIAVAATDTGNNVPYWSSRGPQIAVAAPGVSIYSTYPINNYAYLSGTSMASPHVAGTVALREQLHPGQSPAVIKSLLESTATPLTYSPTVVGAGLVNAYNFVTAP
jgi:subtilisin